MKYFRVMVLVVCGIIASKGSANANADIALLEKKLIDVKKHVDILAKALTQIGNQEDKKEAKKEAAAATVPTILSIGKIKDYFDKLDVLFEKSVK